MRKTPKREYQISSYEGGSRDVPSETTNLPECSHCHKEFSSESDLFECKCGALICNSCREIIASKYHINGLCIHCTQELLFLNKASAEALSSIWQNRFSFTLMNGRLELKNPGIPQI